MNSSQYLTKPSDLLDACDVFIFDCDGVIWKGGALIPGALSTLQTLRKLNKKIFFITNNSTQSRAGFKLKFDALGIDVDVDEILSSSFAVGVYLDSIGFANQTPKKKVYVIGEVGICDELNNFGIPFIGGVKDNGKVPDFSNEGGVDIDQDVGCVVVGFDRNINYYKLQKAQLLLNTLPSCKFIATNTDSLTHLTSTQEWVGNKAFVEAIKACTGRQPIVVGKPSPLLIDYLVDKLELPGLPDRRRICMVGDRLDTDVLFGLENGLRSCLVLSGVTTEQMLMEESNVVFPEYYMGSIADFFKM